MFKPAEKPLAGLRELVLEVKPSFRTLDLSGRILTSLEINSKDYTSKDKIRPEQIVLNGGSAKSVGIMGGDYRIGELIALNRHLRPSGSFRGEGHYVELGDVAGPFATGTPYSMEQMSPSLAKEYEAAREIAAPGRRGDRRPSSMNVALPIDQMTVEHVMEGGKILFEEPGSLRMVLRISGGSAEYSVDYEDYFDVE